MNAKQAIFKYTQQITTPLIFIIWGILWGNDCYVKLGPIAPAKAWVGTRFGIQKTKDEEIFCNLPLIYSVISSSLIKLYLHMIGNELFEPY